MSALKNLTGQKFGKLTVISLNKERYFGFASWLCKCDCGGYKNAPSPCLKNGDIKSCGCLKEKHGMYYSSEYHIFYGMKRRCNNPNCKAYKNYGQRGIKCKYISFKQFIEDVGFRPDKLHQINRIDNNGNYEVGNVNWVTRLENSKNRRPYKKRMSS